LCCTCVDNSEYRRRRLRLSLCHIWREKPRWSKGIPGEILCHRLFIH